MIKTGKVESGKRLVLTGQGRKNNFGSTWSKPMRGSEEENSASHGERSNRRQAMKTTMLLGIILIVLAVLAFAYQGINYTTREKVVDTGPLHMTAEKTRTLPLPPIVGGVALAGGIVLLVMGGKKS
jgi:hypothetical protein